MFAKRFISHPEPDLTVESFKLKNITRIHSNAGPCCARLPAESKLLEALVVSGSWASHGRARIQAPDAPDLQVPSGKCGALKLPLNLNSKFKVRINCLELKWVETGFKALLSVKFTVNVGKRLQCCDPLERLEPEQIFEGCLHCFMAPFKLIIR